MYAGKTTAYIARVEEAQSRDFGIVTAKHVWDNRYGGGAHAAQICTHDQVMLERPTWTVSRLEDLYTILPHIFKADRRGLLAIDEGQFFPRLYEFVEEVRVKYPSVNIVVAGLDMDFMGRPFGDMPKVIAKSNVDTHLKANCACGSKEAIYSHRLAKSKEVVLIGGSESYVPQCEKCFSP
jgi:thymidine kinase